MRLLRILKCVGKAMLKAIAGQVGFGVPRLAEDLWNDWGKEQEEDQRRAELQELVAMAAADYCRQVEEVLKEVAVGQSAKVSQQVRACLEEVRELAQRAFRRPEDESGQSVPPEFSVVKESDLIPFVSFHALDSAEVRDDPVQNTPAHGQVGNVSPQVTIRYQKGDRAGTEEVIAKPSVLIFGRGKQCNPRLAGEQHRRISRHHCLLEVVLPEVRLQDLGSLHGTFVNGELLGKRPPGKAACLYYLLTGHVPRDFPKGKDPWWVILETEAVPIRQRNPAIPQRVAELIDHALREEPKIPFQSAAELKMALIDVL